MSKSIRLGVAAAVLGAATLIAPGAPSAAATAIAVAAAHGTVADRLAAQNELFDQYYEWFLKAHPETATSFGDYRYNNKLSDRSLGAVAQENARERAFLTRLNSIPTSGFSDQDVLSHKVLARQLEASLKTYEFREHEMPVSQMDGPHIDFADLPLSVPLDTVAHYDDYVARLHQIPKVFRDTEEVLRKGRADHLMPVRFLLEKVPGQCAGVIAANPFLKPIDKMPSSFSAADRERLSRAIRSTVDAEVLPAYRQFSDFIAHDYAPYGRVALSVATLEGGEGRYLNDIRTNTTIRTARPDEIHALGLREIERIQGEMAAIARAKGFTDLASFRKALADDPKYRPTSEDQILEDYRRYIGQIRAKLPSLFGLIPDSPVTVEAIPAFQSAMATHYQTGTPDGSRPGRVVVATSDYEHRSLIDNEATAYHEALPGHHFQLSVAQQLKNLPKFRRHSDNSGYVEGWALYSEALGKEVGFYNDPVSDYGRLSSELFRAVRLVVDTGIHAKGWTRDQVVEFMRKTGSIDEPSIQSETDRYIAWPGQALAYKLGQLKIVALRERATRELGPAFDIRSFHDQVLGGGSLPLDLLEMRIDDWIAAMKARR
jgi:uncharacterized protein (DUF885 family)